MDLKGVLIVFLFLFTIAEAADTVVQTNEPVAPPPPPKKSHHKKKKDNDATDTDSASTKSAETKGSEKPNRSGKRHTDYKNLEVDPD